MESNHIYKEDRDGTESHNSDEECEIVLWFLNSESYEDLVIGQTSLLGNSLRPFFKGQINTSSPPFPFLAFSSCDPHIKNELYD